MVQKSDSQADIELPALYRAGDKLSADGQRDYLKANQGLLLLLLGGAAIAALAPAPELLASRFESLTGVNSWLPQVLAVIAAALLSGSLWLAATLRNTKKAEAWYDGRALAESTKSMAWKYMMRAEPYGPSPSAAEVDELFCVDLRKLLDDARPHALPGEAAAGAQITESMRQVRGMDIGQRLATYQSKRIADQRTWYATRSEDHANSSRRWFRITLAINGMALTLGILAVWWLPASCVLGVATTAASCCVAWMQVQRYADLAHSYAFTSHEIGLLEPRATTVRTDEELARFVADCETAFSREHTMWRARREIATS